MSKKCSLKGTSTQFGNNVSHSHRKTRRRFLPNIQSATFISKFLGKISLSVTPRTIRTVDFKGGIDNFLLNTKAKNLSPEGQKLRRKLKKITAANDNAKPAAKKVETKISARKAAVAKKKAPVKKAAAPAPKAEAKKAAPKKTTTAKAKKD